MTNSAVREGDEKRQRKRLALGKGGRHFSQREQDKKTEKGRGNIISGVKNQRNKQKAKTITNKIAST